MPHSPKFWNKIAKKYAAKPVTDEAVYQKKLKLTQEYLEPEMEIMEFGCGTGSTAIVHSPYVKHIDAYDISEQMLDFAREKTQAAGIENIHYECLDISHLDAGDKQYDAVLGLSILHLIEDKDQVIAKTHELLKPGGIFVSSTACLGNAMGYFKYIEPIGRLLGFMPLVKVFTSAALEASITNAGFTIIENWQPGKNSAFIIAKK